MASFAEFDAGWIFAGLAVAAAVVWWLSNRVDDAIEPHDDWDEFDPDFRREDPEDAARRSQV